MILVLHVLAWVIGSGLCVLGLIALGVVVAIYADAAAGRNPFE